jgi:hypothetical protein
LDAASPLVPGNGGADMVSEPLACSSDFLLRLSACQGEDPIVEARRTALAASWFRRQRDQASARALRRALSRDDRSCPIVNEIQWSPNQFVAMVDLYGCSTIYI